MKETGTRYAVSLVGRSADRHAFVAQERASFGTHSRDQTVGDFSIGRGGTGNPRIRRFSVPERNTRLNTKRNAVTSLWVQRCLHRIVSRAERKREGNLLDIVVLALRPQLVVGGAGRVQRRASGQRKLFVERLGQAGRDARAL